MTYEEELKCLELANKIGLSPMYDASRASYHDWRSKVLALAQQIKNMPCTGEAHERPL